jgi:hypothetical protein
MTSDHLVRVQILAGVQSNLHVLHITPLNSPINFFKGRIIAIETEPNSSETGAVAPAIIIFHLQ